MGIRTEADEVLDSLIATDASADGSVIVGEGGHAAGGTGAFRWTMDGGYEISAITVHRSALPVLRESRLMVRPSSAPTLVSMDSRPSHGLNPRA